MMAITSADGGRIFSCEPTGLEPAQAVAMPLQITSLPHALRLDANVISGGQPAGEAGFAALRELGVHTVISVDGARPDVAGAKKYGLRYVHLPHGYDGIPQRRMVELATAIATLPGPIYVHCHHGKHRSPAAAAVACIGTGLMTRAAGAQFLKLAGTSEDYRGLYDAVAGAKRLERLDARNVTFREIVAVPPLASAMVQLERSLDKLRLIEQAGWQTPPSHPDLAPLHEALLLREHFTEMQRSDDVRRRLPVFRELLDHSREQAVSLEQQLRAATATPPNAVARARYSAALNTIREDCKRCHRDHRDHRDRPGTAP